MEKNKIAELLMSLKCVQISTKNPFNYASGLIGPIYCDNRKIISHVDARRNIIDAFLDKIKKSDIKFNSVAGLATAGIPHAAWIAEKMNLPMIYVRGKAKEHGKKNQIEGDYSLGDRVIVIEDLVNQGSSLENAVMGLKDAGLEVAACFCIVNYQMKTVEKLLQKLDISLFSLTDFSSILEVSKEFLKLSKEDISDLLEWQERPRNLERKKGLIVSDRVKIEIDGKHFEFPVIEGTENEKAIDISKLRAQTQHITIDNGFGNTGSCQSSITYLDGERGILRYRGYPIEQIAEKSNFVECAYLLYFGELPSSSELSKFKKGLKGHSLPKGIKDIIDCFPKTAHPMAVLSSTMAALSGFSSKENLTVSTLNSDEILCQMMEQICSITARFYRNSLGKKPINGDPSLSYVENFLYMMFGKKVDKEVAKALDTLLILHADHEQNCSSSTVRMVGSSKANPYVCISSGVSALWGPLHGGANQEVMNMLEQIQKDGGDFKSALTRAKDKSNPFKLMGFGHRVYKNFDPRAKIIKAATETVLQKLGVRDPLLDLARGLEAEALKDPYFVERKLYPNVDFYSGIIYRALGIPTNMFTVMFAIGRLPGWMAQWKEMISSKEPTKIARPRQVYVGSLKRDYKSLKER